MDLKELDKIYNEYLLEEKKNINILNNNSQNDAIKLMFSLLYFFIYSYYFKKFNIDKLDSDSQQTFFCIMHQKIIFYFLAILFCLKSCGNNNTLNIFN